MRFLVDAQLPPALAEWLRYVGHDALHTSELPAGNATTDADVVRAAVEQQRIVVSKDRDFPDLLLTTGRPHQLLAVTLGNTLTGPLLAHFRQYWPELAPLLATHRYLALGPAGITVFF